MILRSKEDWCTLLQSAPYSDSNPEETFAHGGQLVMHMREKGWLKEGDSFLDIGCGSGKVPIHLLPCNISYTGIDVSPANLAYCRRAFSPWPQCTFVHIDCKNSLYHPEGTLLPEAINLPFGEQTFDVVMLNSVFTHMERFSACERYLAEILRVLRPGGFLFSTWFRSPPNDIHSGADRTVFPEQEIRRMLRKFTWVEDWGGTTYNWHDQWQIVVRATMMSGAGQS